MKIHIRIGLVVLALLGLLTLTACVGGGDTAPRNNAEIDQATCIDEVGRDVCAAKKHEQITIEVPFNTSSAEVKNANGKVVGSLSEGDTVRIVCFRWVGQWPQYGILMEDVTTDQSGAQDEFGYPDRFTTGTVGTNLVPVGFVRTNLFGTGEAIEHDELRPQLEERFDDLAENSCEDNRVIVDHAGQSIVAGQPAE